MSSSCHRVITITMARFFPVCRVDRSALNQFHSLSRFSSESASADPRIGSSTTIRCPVRPDTPAPAPTARYPPPACVCHSSTDRFVVDSQQRGSGNAALCSGESIF